MSALDEFLAAYEHWRVVEPHRATTAAAGELGISRATAGRWLARARAQGLVSTDNPHRPSRARWCNATNGRPSWVACLECREPWPCQESRATA